MNRKIIIIVILAVVIIAGIIIGKKRTDQADLDMSRSAPQKMQEVAEIEIDEVDNNSMFDSPEAITDVKLTTEYLTGKEYLLTNLFNGSEIMIGFDGDEFYGKAPVNRYFGMYEIGSDNFTIDKSGSTMMAGRDKDMQNETEYFAMLNAVKSAYLTDKQALVLVTNKGDELIFIEGKIVSEDNL